MRIGIDVMGGDHAPTAILEGAILSLDQLSEDDHLVLFGDGPTINDDLKRRDLQNDPRVEVVATTQVIEMDDSPTKAIRSKPDSSIVRMTQMANAKTPEAERLDAIISAGNTGAYVASAQMMMRRLPGVERPGVAVTLPTFYGPVVVLDAGANLTPKASHLAQYGQMASIYAKAMLGIDRPRVGLVSVGGEESKGTDMVKQAAEVMRSNQAIDYVGYAEGRDLFSNTCDVAVTDGFTGNIVLKLAEGLASGLFQTIGHEIKSKAPELAERFGSVMKAIYAKHDYHEYGGAPLLGAAGTCLICHGSSEPRTIYAAVREAIKCVRLNINQEIVAALSNANVSTNEADA